VGGAGLLPLLEAHGFDFFAGVPCSLIEELIRALESHPRLPYVAAVREDVAVGVAAGAWFAGRRPVVLMQNSGLGTSLNALASLSLMYRLPALLLVTWRGYGGKDAPEHILMGDITPKLLELLGLPYRVLSDASLAGDVAWAASEMDAHSSPVALLVPPGLNSEGGSAPLPTAAAGLTARSRPASPQSQDCAGKAGARTRPISTLPDELTPRISRLAALGAVIKRLGGEPAVHANGYMCRESFSIADRPQNFYMIGSMGLASAIGLGLTTARPSPKTLVLDGDGNLLMNLGILPMVGAMAPVGLIHCVFDNEVYGSTGNQASLSRESRLDRLAAAAGYRRVVAATEPDEIDAALDEMLTNPGPHFLLVKVTTEEADVPRIPHAPQAIRDRFRRHVASA
jgi:phosphonopyruvate decarboxylase